MSTINDEIEDILFEAGDNELALDPGINLALLLLCRVLGVDPKDVTWDAATETLDGDTSQEICSILEVAFGEEFHDKLLSAAHASPPDRNAIVEAVAGLFDDYMTSDIHHPNHVLIPVEKFEQLRALTEEAKP